MGIEANGLTNELLELKRPFLRLRKGRKKLKAIYERYQDFHERYADWELDTANFLLLPEFPNVRARNTTIYVLHFTQTLRDQVHRVEDARSTLIHSLEGRGEGLKDQETWLYTIIAFVLSALAFAGLDLGDTLDFLATVGSDLLLRLETVLARF